MPYLQEYLHSLYTIRKLSYDRVWGGVWTVKRVSSRAHDEIALNIINKSNSKTLQTCKSTKYMHKYKF